MSSKVSSEQRPAHLGLSLGSPSSGGSGFTGACSSGNYLNFSIGDSKVCLEALKKEQTALNAEQKKARDQIQALIGQQKEEQAKSKADLDEMAKRVRSFSDEYSKAFQQKDASDKEMNEISKRLNEVSSAAEKILADIKTPNKNAEYQKLPELAQKVSQFSADKFAKAAQHEDIKKSVAALKVKLEKATTESQEKSKEAESIPAQFRVKITFIEKVVDSISDRILSVQKGLDFFKDLEKGKLRLEKVQPLESPAKNGQKRARDDRGLAPLPSPSSSGKRHKGDSQNGSGSSHSNGKKA